MIRDLWDADGIRIRNHKTNPLEVRYRLRIPDCGEALIAYPVRYTW